MTALPKEIGPYRIEGLIKDSELSILYLATHPETGEPLAIKVLSPEHMVHEESVRRFFNEAEAIRRTDHPHIVKLYGQGEWEGGIYLAMELIEGVPLGEYLQTHPIPLRRALHMLLDIAYALGHLHTHGVIHRDLKPDNILVTHDGEIKVIDFGIAQILKRRQRDQPPVPLLLGTPIYMSPEQRRDPTSVSFPSDIFSLGIIAYELVLGKLSYGKIHLGLIPQGLQKIIHKALQKDPKYRYQDVADFISAVTEYQHDQLIQEEEDPTNRINTLLEEMLSAHDTFLLPSLPLWKHYTLALIHSRTLSLPTSLFHFATFPNGQQAIFSLHSTSPVPMGTYHLLLAKGLLTALIPHTNPTDLAHELNTLLLQDPKWPALSFASLLLDPRSHAFTYQAFGHPPLYLHSGDTIRPLSSDNIALGLEPLSRPTATTHSWKAGDILYFPPPLPEHAFFRFVEKQHTLPLQKQLENLEKIILTTHPKLGPFSLTALQAT
ncbi:MAG: protein kinase [Chlamydiia bacterium]|nr:protein kinase [Chlamydiia bacterium]